MNFERTTSQKERDTGCNANPRDRHPLSRGVPGRLSSNIPLLSRTEHACMHVRWTAHITVSLRPAFVGLSWSKNCPRVPTPETGYAASINSNNRKQSRDIAIAIVKLQHYNVKDEGNVSFGKNSSLAKIYQIKNTSGLTDDYIIYNLFNIRFVMH